MERFRNDRGMTGESGLSLEEVINLKNKAFIDETGDYNELIEKLWFHFSGTNEKITKDYSVFVSYYGEFKGKYTILEFTFRGCGGCIFVKPFLEEFYKRNKDKAEVIAIYRDTKENWIKEGQEHKVSYHEWSDPTQATEPVADYDVYAFPTFVIIDPNGKILDKKEGASGFYEIIKKYIPDAEVEKKLENALNS